MDPATILPLSKCYLSPVGIHSLRIHLNRDEKTYKKYKKQFDTADIAFFVGGLHDDGRHVLERDQLHDMWKKARDGTGTHAAGRTARNLFRRQFEDVVFDMLTAYDRMTGGSTIMVHVDGSQAPGAPVVPEQMRAHVYFNPALRSEMPETSISIAKIVQEFMEGMAVPALLRYRRATTKVGFDFDAMIGTISNLRPPISQPLIPSPQQGTHYVFWGRPPGELEDLIEAFRDDMAWRQGPIASPGIRIERDHRIEELDRMRDEVLRLTKINADQENEIDALRGQLETLCRQHGLTPSRAGLTPPPAPRFGSIARAVPPTVLAPAPVVHNAVPTDVSLSETISSVSSITPSVSRSSDRLPAAPPSTPAQGSKYMQRLSTSHDRFTEYGPHTATLIRAKGLKNGVHRCLWDIERAVVDTRWAPELELRLACSEELAEELAAAMRRDAPLLL